MENNFNEGDIIVYNVNSESSFYYDESGREQVIRLKTNTHYYTDFLDTDVSNSFEIGSVYDKKCVFVRVRLKEYRNGVPIVWGDVI